MKNQFKTIAFWAKTNPWSARILIIIFKTTLNLIAVFAGFWLYLEGIKIAGILIPIAVLLAVGSYLLYKNEKFLSKFKYAGRKICEAAVLNAVFILFTAFGNVGGVWLNSIETAQPISVLTASKKKTDTTDRPTKKIKKKEFRKFVKTKIRELKKANNETDPVAKVLLLLVGLTLAVLLEYGVLALACSLSCGGSELLAIIVFLVGTGLIIFGLVKLIQELFVKMKKTD